MKKRRCRLRRRPMNLFVTLLSLIFSFDKECKEGYSRWLFCNRKASLSLGDALRFQIGCHPAYSFRARKAAKRDTGFGSIVIKSAVCRPRRLNVFASRDQPSPSRRPYPLIGFSLKRFTFSYFLCCRKTPLLLTALGFQKQTKRYRQVYFLH